VLHCEYFETKSEALKREKELKSGKGREWINLNIENWKKSFG
jgi:putative endonuclease